jgi:methylated-DNA-[protein]-cysteine S-methyltransferase
MSQTAKIDLPPHSRGSAAHPGTARVIESPLGAIQLTAQNGALVAVTLLGESGTSSTTAPGAALSLLERAAAQLAEYFAGIRIAFDVPLAPQGTVFQRSVWAQLAAIPHGETRSYRDIARAVGNPAACRAVGAANAKNPIAIIVPCHRVIGASGTLTGYAGGLLAKQWLLEHEQRQLRVPLA